MLKDLELHYITLHYICYGLYWRLCAAECVAGLSGVYCTKHLLK